MRTMLGICAGVVYVLLVSLAASAEVRYTVTDLGTLGGSRSSAFAINSLGQIVGESFTADGQEHAFVYSGGSLTDLGTLTGTAGSYSVAYGINNLGHVVGVSSAAGGRHAFLYSNGVMTDIDTLGTPDSVARGINDRGQITGEVVYAGFSMKAFLFENGVMTDLGTLPFPGSSSSAGRAINDDGVIVGYSTGSNQYNHFVKYDGAWTDLDPNSTVESDASDINDLGVIVGSYHIGGSRQHGFVYSNGVSTDLGVLGDGMSWASAINNLGQIVGSSLLGPSQRRAVIYEDGAAIDLNSLIAADSGWVLSYANDINDQGWIVGTGSTPDSIEKAFLLVPVPEPATLALLALGGLVALRRRR